MIWWSLAAAAVLLALLPLGIRAVYAEGGARVWLILGPVRLRLYPAKGKKKKRKMDAGETKTDTPSGAAPTSGEKKGGSVKDFLPLARIALDFLGDFRRKLRVNRLEMNVILAGDDPCDLAVNYGRAWAALGNLEPLLSRLFVIQKKNLQVQCDFTADKTLVWARADLTIAFGRLAVLFIRYGWRLLVDMIKIRNQRKGGALQ